MANDSALSTGQGGVGDFPTLTPPGTTPVIRNIFDFSAESLGQLKLWFEQNPPSIPITNITGFTQFTAQAATPVATREGTNSATYTDLTTVGPTLTGLPDGKYLVLFGARCSVDTGVWTAYMSVKGNTTEAVDADAIVSGTVGVNTASGSARAIVLTLANGGNNTLTARYKIQPDNTHSANFENRWLVALKYANA